jgi:hypothetical protein
MKSQFSFISLFSFWDVLWLCYQLIIHACSNTDLRKFDLCKFSSAFLVFQCGASGRSTLTSRRTGGPDSSPLESGLRWSQHVRTGPDGVWTPAVIIVRTVSLYRPDGRGQSAPFRGCERPDVINPPSGRGPHRGYENLCSPHSHSTPQNLTFGWLWVPSFCEFLAFCIFPIFQVLCFSPYLFSFF